MKLIAVTGNYSGAEVRVDSCAGSFARPISKDLSYKTSKFYPLLFRPQCEERREEVILH